MVNLHAIKIFTEAPATLAVVLILLCSAALAQPSVHDVAGTASLNGNPALIGDQIVAKDSLGSERGTFTVSTQGFYGILHINGNDPGSSGDAISFYINGIKAQQTLSWQPFGYDPDFNLTACDLSTYLITVDTDSQLYYPGQNMTISGYIMNSQCSLEPWMMVAYSVPSTPIMGQMQTNGTGYFIASTAIPSDMILGNYTLWASYPAGENDTIFSTKDFAVTLDKDGDGYNLTADCNDSSPSVHPGAAETCGNGIDEDCSGSDSICALSASSSSGGGGGGYYCLNNWSCTDWSACQPTGIQSRTCTDINKCLASIAKPAESQNCTYIPPIVQPQITACTPGTRSCSGNDLMECSIEHAMVKIQTCEFGCSGDACLEKPAEQGPAQGEGQTATGQGASTTGFSLLDASSWPYWLGALIIIILIIWFLLKRRKKKVSGG